MCGLNAHSFAVATVSAAVATGVVLGGRDAETCVHSGSPLGRIQSTVRQLRWLAFDNTKIQQTQTQSHTHAHLSCFTASL